MVIHVVAQGETLQSIADEYGVSASRLIEDNDITNPNDLAVGQAVLIVYPNQVHTVQEGDSLSGIAQNYGITEIQLLRNNPFLADREYIYPGESLIIDFTDEKAGNITTNGYAYPYIDRSILKKNLLYLTYLSIFNYSITESGELNNIEDEELINLAKSYGVAPIMVISNVNPAGQLDRETLHNILADETVRNNLTLSVLNTLNTKGYYGLNIDLPYIRSEDRQLYLEYITDLVVRVKSSGYKIFFTINPNTFEEDGAPGAAETVDLTELGRISDGIILLSYTWGSISEIPIEAIPLYILEVLLQYTLTQIPPEKITIGITSIGYIWELPYLLGTSRANSISNTNAVQLAADVNAVINYNPGNLASYFYVIDDKDYLVYFHDVRGVDRSLEVMTQYGLTGVGIWNVMYYLAQTFTLINAKYYIENVI
jgi:spore germination protein